MCRICEVPVAGDSTTLEARLEFCLAFSRYKGRNWHHQYTLRFSASLDNFRILRLETTTNLLGSPRKLKHTEHGVLDKTEFLLGEKRMLKMVVQRTLQGVYRGLRKQGYEHMNSVMQILGAYGPWWSRWSRMQADQDWEISVSGEVLWTEEVGQ
jgi:hypothetical protein